MLLILHWLPFISSMVFSERPFLAVICFFVVLLFSHYCSHFYFIKIGLWSKPTPFIRKVGNSRGGFNDVFAIVVVVDPLKIRVWSFSFCCQSLSLHIRFHILDVEVQTWWRFFLFYCFFIIPHTILFSGFTIAMILCGFVGLFLFFYCCPLLLLVICRHKIQGLLCI